MLLFWFHSEVKFLTRFDVFFDLVNLVDFNPISIDLCVVKCFICIYFVYMPCLSVGECLYKRFIIRLKNLNEFLFNVFIYVKEGGSLMHVYVLEHSLSYRTD